MKIRKLGTSNKIWKKMDRMLWLNCTTATVETRMKTNDRGKQDRRNNQQQGTTDRDKGHETRKKRDIVRKALT